MNVAGLNLSSFTISDWLLIALLAASVIRAFVRGFIREIVSIVGTIAGILLASWSYDVLAVKLVLWLSPIVPISFIVADIAAFIGIVVGVMLAASLIGRFLRSGVGAIGLGLVDRLLGAAFGAVRGYLLGIACLMVVTAFAPSAGIIRNSQLLPYFLEGARGVSFVVPGTLQQQLADGADWIKHSKPVWIKPPR